MACVGPIRIFEGDQEALQTSPSRGNRAPVSNASDALSNECIPANAGGRIIAYLKRKMGTFSGSCGNDLMNFVVRAFGNQAWKGKPIYKMKSRHYRNPHRTMISAPRDYASKRGGKWYWIVHDPGGGKKRVVEIKTGMIIHVQTGYQYKKYKAGKWSSQFTYGHWLMFAVKNGKLYVFDSLARRGNQFRMSGGWAHQRHGRFREYKNDAWVGGVPATAANPNNTNAPRARTTAIYDPPAGSGGP